MLVKCPKCSTTYRVSDELFKGIAPAFRCSRCKHTFELDAESPREARENRTDRQDPTPRGREDRELSFAFEAKEATEPAGKKTEGLLPDTAAENQAVVAVSKDHLDPWSMSESGHRSEKSFTFSDTRAPGQSDKIFHAAEDPQTDAPQFEASQRDASDNVLSLDPYREQQTSTAPYLTLFGLLVIFYALVAVFNYAHPQATEAVVRKIPLVGSSVLRNNHLKKGVVLQSLRADYQNIQGNQEVFVITGVALNQNPVTIREVRVTGQVYNQEGKRIERQTVWIGNAISPKIVRGMTAQDIADLQRLPPLKSFDIPPGDSVPFTIVFLRDPKDVKDFTCDIVAAQGDIA